jgi:hypothetical protein
MTKRDASPNIGRHKLYTLRGTGDYLSSLRDAAWGGGGGPMSYFYIGGTYYNEHMDPVSFDEVKNNYILPNADKYYNSSTLGYDNLYIVRNNGLIHLAGSIGGEIKGLEEGKFTTTNGTIMASVLAASSDAICLGLIRQSGGNENGISSGWSLDFFHNIPFVTSPLVDKNSGFTLGPIVILGSNITQGSKGGRDVIKHEAGHVLYFYTIPLNYYLTNAIPSMIDYWLTDGGPKHRTFWAEKEANTLSRIFIGPFETPEDFPTYLKK